MLTVVVLNRGVYVSVCYDLLIKKSRLKRGGGGGVSGLSYLTWNYSKISLYLA